jgi:ribose transport system ATP-binding protein
VLGPERLVITGLRRGTAVRDVSFTVRAGEILAIAGLVGAGRTETLRLIFGADQRDAGEIMLDGRRLDIRSPRDAIAAGIGLLTEDRKLQGLVLGRSVRENFSLPNLDRLSRLGVVAFRREREVFGRQIDRLRIRVPHQEEPARNLSGGNQQKVVLAKWLERDCDVLFFDEPTRGIDVGARHEIYLLMNDLAARGRAIVMVSSELPEVLGLADRILVMHDGRITGDIMNGPDVTQEQVMRLAMA